MTAAKMGTSRFQPISGKSWVSRPSRKPAAAERAAPMAQV